jgi:hypothetical protein
VPEHPYVPGRRIQETGDASDRRGLPGPVRPEQSEDRTRLGGEADPADGYQIAVFLTELADFDHGLPLRLSLERTGDMAMTIQR